MEKIFLIFLFCACGAPAALAQPSGSGAVESMVGASLTGLKNSYQKLLDQNRFLTSEIEAYRSHIQSLNQERGSLKSRKIKLSEMLRDQTKLDNLSPSVVYSQEIEQLKRKIDSVSEKTIEKAFLQKKSDLETALERSRKGVRAVRSNMDRIQGESAGSAALITQLKQRQAQLQRQIPDAQSALEVESAKAYARQLDKEIARLEALEKKLQMSLSRNHGEEEADMAILTEEGYQLRRKFVDLQDENLRLKREVSRLEPFLPSAGR